MPDLNWLIIAQLDKKWTRIDHTGKKLYDFWEKRTEDEDHPAFDPSRQEVAEFIEDISAFRSLVGSIESRRNSEATAVFAITGFRLDYSPIAPLPL